MLTFREKLKRKKHAINLLCIFLLAVVPGCEAAHFRQYLNQAEYNQRYAVNQDSFKLDPRVNELIQDALHVPLLAANLKALALFKSGKVIKAQALLADSLARNARYYNTYFIKANMHAACHEWVQALDTYKILIKLLPDSARLYFNRAQIYLALQQTNNCLADLQHSLALNPFFYESSVLAGKLYMRKGAYAQALSLFMQALTRQRLPDTADVYANRARAFYEQADYAAALTDYSRALQLKPGMQQVAYQQLLAYARAGEGAALRSKRESYASRFPDTVLLTALDSELAFLQRDREGAAVQFQKLLSLAPQYVSYYLSQSETTLHDREFVGHFFYSVQRPLKICLLGDSMAGGALSWALANAINLKPTLNFTCHYKVSSGLSNIWFYDWQKQIPAILAEKYDLILVMLGTNDGQNFNQDNQYCAFGTDIWRKAYTARVAGMLGTLAEGARLVYWIGMPPMLSAKFNEKMVLLNSVYKEVAESIPNARYVSAFQLLGGESGAYLPYIKVNGIQRATRASDGVHITLDGITPLRDGILKKIAADFCLPSGN